jgi:asparagine synthase (glutamine-hydrolysing)
MCGIVGGFNTDIQEGVNMLAHRGPDAAGHCQINKIALGHTRLSIIDLDDRSNQPFTYGNTTIVFNGEIWNYKQLRADLEAMGCHFQTQGDTEVLAAALNYRGPDILPQVQGMFAVAWTTDGDTLFLARDRFGETPLHFARQRPFMFASEKKTLLALGAHPLSIEDVQPGHYLEINEQQSRQVCYYDAPINVSADGTDTASQRVGQLLNAGTVERLISDVPVCTLLSGGIDSAAVAYILKQHLPDLVAYTAVYNPKSSDLKSARLVAQALDIQLVEVEVANPTAEELADIVWRIEMPYKAQVEISWPCLQLAKAMRRDGFKVTFSGEGSDELWGSYGFAYHALKTQSWHQYRKDLFMTQARKNFMRCNKIFMAHSIECRLPFLHPALVEYAIGLRQEAVQNGRNRPKAVLQNAFRGLLPDAIINRAKVAFQDGMGIKQAIAQTIHNPKVFYNAEYKARFAR